MSLDALRWAWSLAGLTPTEKLVVLALADRWNDDTRRCWPSLADIAKRCCLSIRAVRGALRRLEERGLVTAQRRVAETGVSTSNEYFLAVSVPGTTCRLPGTTCRLPGTMCRVTRQDVPGDPAPRAAESEVESPRESKPSSSPAATTREPAGFAEFWNAYPRRVGKAAARKAWVRLKVNGRCREILAAIERAKLSRQWQESGGQYIPHPATWLNRHGWEDELEQALPAADHRRRLN